VVRVFKEIPFSREGTLVVKEFVYQLTNQIVMQGLNQDEQRIMVLISRVVRVATTWLKQHKALHLDEDFSTIVQTLVGRYKDRLKHKKAFQRLNTVRQGDRTVKKFNQEFTTILIDLETRPTEEVLI
jgi:Ty3 transposon capsid-like protein